MLKKLFGGKVHNPIDIEPIKDLEDINRDENETGFVYVTADTTEFRSEAGEEFNETTPLRTRAKSVCSTKSTRSILGSHFDAVFEPKLLNE